MEVTPALGEVKVSGKDPRSKAGGRLKSDWLANNRKGDEEWAGPAGTGCQLTLSGYSLGLHRSPSVWAQA